jgi:hypothetical protein
MQTETTATLELPGFTLTAEGILGSGLDWTLTTTYELLRPTVQRVNINFWDEDDVTKFLWDEAVELLQKYHPVKFFEEEIEDLDS